VHRARQPPASTRSVTVTAAYGGVADEHATAPPKILTQSICAASGVIGRHHSAGQVDQAVLADPGVHSATRPSIIWADNLSGNRLRTATGASPLGTGDARLSSHSRDLSTARQPMCSTPAHLLVCFSLAERSPTCLRLTPARSFGWTLHDLRAGCAVCRRLTAWPHRERRLRRAVV
jgi:hypothetical protein